MLISNEKDIQLNEAKKAKVYIFAVVAIVLSVMICCGCLVYYIDPFFHYHAPLEGFPYVIDDQLTQNPGMAEQFDYDSAILGSSMTVNFRTDYFKELMGLNTLKLSYSSAYPKDISNILEKIYEPRQDGRAHEVKKIFLGLDVITYSGAVDETKYPLPVYLYDKNPINDIKYLVNKDVLLNYVLRPMVDPEPTNLSEIYMSWWTDEYYDEDRVLLGHDYIEEINPDKLPWHAFDEPIEENLRVNIIPYIEAHPETEFVIFFPPYSILFFNDAIMNSHIEATLNSYRIVEKVLNQYDNVSMYFFPAMTETITDLNNYADYTHYHPDINKYMAECFVDGKYYIAKEDEAGAHMSDYMEVMDKTLDEYDFEALHAKQRSFH